MYFIKQHMMKIIQDKHVTEFEYMKENGEQNIGKENKLLSTNFQVKIENLKLTTKS